ncbi:CotY/CotZ family spore coat protein [Jeotgalibacillus proteolyticus]|uniref:Spore coat protein CotZ n=1 Tax=Jeotgalibacillus proteolyticus TaxID=2082395 RepID=A0A2S5GGY6_9BACL|nr:CotY/CotZ family spore coat protein [Jeotgalibacillus proteolyticus]PPA72312.1 spore coat protein CotZ [Jeotgalibacillus proteolyticus]
MSCCGKRDDDVLGSSRGCVCEVVRAIKDIQDNAVEEECRPCLTSCFLEPLGDLTAPSRRKPADTRVFVLKTKDGSPFHAFFRDGDRYDHDCVSIFFRVEEIFDNCCATLRVLEPKDKDHKEVDLLSDCGTKIKLSKICKVFNFESTDSCITVDLNCFCAVQCIKDVFLGICD